MRSAATVFLALAAAFLGAGCGEPGSQGSAAADQTYAVERTASGGPVRLTVRLSKEEVGLADTLTLEEEVAAEPGYAAELPEFLPEEFDGLGVVDVDEAPAEKGPAGTVLRRRLTLEPERSGELVIPPREAWFHREGADAESSVESKEIEVRVDPIADAGSISLPPPRPALRKADVEPAGGFPAWGAIALGLVAAAAGVVLYRRRKGRPAPPPRPAHEIAWESLRRLVALELIEKGEVERFFVVLSAILREYVERRFGVRAPERTTKEFLAECASHPRLGAFRKELDGFLSVADRVKFARFEPEESDVQEAFDLVRSFVTRTGEEAPDA